VNDDDPIPGLLGLALEKIKLGRYEEVISVFDEIVALVGTPNDELTFQLVGQALKHKALALNTLGRHVEEISVYDNIVDWFGGSSAPESREIVSRALINKVAALFTIENYAQAPAVCRDAIRRFGDESDQVSTDAVAAALLGEAFALERLGKYADAIAVHEEIFGRFSTTKEPSLRGAFAISLYNKAICFNLLGRHVEAVASWNDLLKRFRNTADATEKALLDRARALGKFYKKSNIDEERPEQALFVSSAQIIDFSDRQPLRAVGRTFIAPDRRVPYDGTVIPLRVGVGTETAATENLKNAIKLDERGIPLKAPSLWPGKDQSDLPIDVYFRRKWGRYLKKGLSLSDIKRLDPTLHNSLKRHFRNKLPWPDELKFPNERTNLQWAVEQFKKGNVEILTPKQVVAVGRWLKRQELQPEKPPSVSVNPKAPGARARRLGS
jgi:hypothetical protein